MAIVWKKLKRSFKFYIISLFRIDDGSEHVARGFALGSIVNFFPTFGFGFVASGFVAGVFRGNVLAGIVGGVIHLLLWPILFFLNMQTGGLFYKSHILIDELEDVTESAVDALVLGKTFMFGAVINSLIYGLIIYVFIYLLHRKFRARILAWFAKRKRSKRNASIS